MGCVKIISDRSAIHYYWEEQENYCCRVLLGRLATFELTTVKANALDWSNNKNMKLNNKDLTNFFMTL